MALPPQHKKLRLCAELIRLRLTQKLIILLPASRFLFSIRKKYSSSGANIKNCPLTFSFQLSILLTENVLRAPKKLRCSTPLKKFFAATAADWIFPKHNCNFIRTRIIEGNNKTFLAPDNYGRPKWLFTFFLREDKVSTAATKCLEDCSLRNTRFFSSCHLFNELT